MKKSRRRRRRTGQCAPHRCRNSDAVRQDGLRRHYCELVFLTEAELTDDVRAFADSAPLYPGGLCAFVGRRHPWKKRRSVTARELRDAPLILPPALYCPVLDAAMLDALGQPANITYSSNSTDFRVHIISEDLVGIMPMSSRTIENEYIRCLPVVDVSTGFGLQLVWNRSEEKSALRRFLAAVPPAYAGHQSTDPGESI